MSWWDGAGDDPSRLPVFCLQPAVKLKENDGFARNAQWALIQNHPWEDRRERFLATDDNGEPLEKEYVKQYFREWVETEDCPWYLRQQYFQDNERQVRGVSTATGQVGKKRPQATAQEDFWHGRAGHCGRKSRGFGESRHLCKSWKSILRSPGRQSSATSIVTQISGGIFKKWKSRLLMACSTPSRPTYRN